MGITVPYFVQNREFTCGPACLRMVLAFHGHDMDEVSLAMLCGTTVAGTSLNEIATGATQLGFQAVVAIGQTLADIGMALQLSRPVIAVVDAGELYERRERIGYKHMVVITGLDQVGIHFHDPEHGPDLVVPTERFEAAWNAMRKGMVTIWR